MSGQRRHNHASHDLYADLTMSKRLVSLLVFTCATAGAADEQQFTGWGLGQAACRVFVKHAENDATGKNRLIYLQWFNGYMTGINFARRTIQDISQGIDRDAMFDSVLSYCQHSGDAYVWQGINSAIGERGDGSPRH